MVESLVRGSALPAPVIQQIVEHSDGVPLFVEELTRAVLDTGAAQIPTTLQDTLTARLDQVGEAKHTAQLGAVIGRRFSDALIRAVSPLDEDVLQQDLRHLVGSELLYRRGIGRDAVYRFKHALIQDAVYSSLLRRTRQQLHGQIAQVLETQFPDVQEMQPELIAHHYTEAGRHEQAVTWWQEAAQQARARSAEREAAEHAMQGIAVLSLLPESQARMRQELKLLRVLGVAQVAIAGYAASEVEQTYTRAQALCRHLDDPEQVFSILHGLRNFYLVRAELDNALNLCNDILTIAQRLQSPELLLHAHMQYGHTLIHLGRLTSARRHFEAALRLYAPYSHVPPTDLAGQDARMFTRAWLAHTLSILGYLDQARRWSDESMTLAHELTSSFNLMNALAYRTGFHRRRRELAAAEEAGKAFRKIVSEHGFPQQTAVTTIRQGIRLMQQGQIEAGQDLLQQGITDYRATGSVIRFPLTCVSVIEVYRDAGQAEAGLSIVAEALDHSNRTGERWYDAELYRLKGELQLVPSIANSAAAESCFHQALAIARGQQAKLWELRAAMSLARLWQQQGKRQAACDLLVPVYGWFTEGFDAADLQDAKALLEALES
jgi:predicted ATPase